MLTVNEMFYSLEGEGPYIGIPTFFIRLTGCNLRCEWCDTKYSFYLRRLSKNMPSKGR